MLENAIYQIHALLFGTCQTNSAIRLKKCGHRKLMYVAVQVELWLHKNNQCALAELHWSLAHYLGNWPFFSLKASARLILVLKAIM